MARPVTLFTGQWADLPLTDLAAKAAGWGYDGLELACWGDHFDVVAALTDRGYAVRQREQLERHELGCWALGAHLVGQALSDPIDARHERILPREVWGDGESEGVRERAAERLADTARAAAAFGVTQVNGFTGSPVWHLLYSFPPNDFAEVERGYEEVAERLGPVLDVFEAEGVRFGLEVHPTEIAYDFVTTRRTLDAVRRQSFGINLDPSHFAPQFLDPAEFAREFGDRNRGWDFVSPGHGDVDFDELFRALNEIGYAGPLSVEWEDSGMDREFGAAEAVGFVRRADFVPSDLAFDAAMQRNEA